MLGDLSRHPVTFCATNIFTSAIIECNCRYKFQCTSAVPAGFRPESISVPPPTTGEVLASYVCMPDLSGEPALTGADGLVLLTGTDRPTLNCAYEPVLASTDGPVLTDTDGPVLAGTDEPAFIGTDGPVLASTDEPAFIGTDGPTPTSNSGPVILHQRYQ